MAAELVALMAAAMVVYSVDSSVSSLAGARAGLWDA
jgi:hypothetical protein